MRTHPSQRGCYTIYNIIYILYTVSGVKRHMGMGFCKITIKCYAPTPRGVEILPIRMTYVLYIRVFFNIAWLGDR